MEDFPLLILFFIIYLIAGASGGKRRKKTTQSTGRQGPMRRRAQGEQYDPGALHQDRQTMEGFQNAFSDGAPSMPSCDQRRMHLHEVSSEQMQYAAEGEDPCHVGSAPEDHEMNEDESEQEIGQFGQDVLRGVIMSEILTRPCERMMRRGRR